MVLQVFDFDVFMSPVIVALLSFAIAFVAGAMLSKAFFTTRAQATDMVEREKHHALLKAQRSRYRKRVMALHNLVRRHEETQQQIKEKLAHYHQVIATAGESHRSAKIKIGKLLAESTTARKTVADIERERSELTARITSLEADLQSEHARSADAANELGLLCIEREELTARIRRLEQEHQTTSEAVVDTGNGANEPAADLRASMGALRETLAARDQTIFELNVQLREENAREQRLQERLETMKNRVSPLTQKLRQQRQLLRQLRQASALRDARGPAGTVSRDDLKEIRGIGPALERKLRSHGIEQFKQIAVMSEQELADVSAQLSIAPNMGRRQGWIQQACELHRHLHPSD